MDNDNKPEEKVVKTETVDLNRSIVLYVTTVDRVGVDGEATIMICLPGSLVDIASFSLPPG